MTVEPVRPPSKSHELPRTTPVNRPAAFHWQHLLRRRPWRGPSLLPCRRAVVRFRGGQPKTGPPVAGRPLPDLAVPHLSLVHVWAHPARLAKRTHKRAAPCGRRPWQDETHPATLPAAGVAQHVPGPTSALPQPHRGCSTAHRPFPARPFTQPNKPQEGNGYTREGLNSKPRRPATQIARTPTPPRKPRPLVENWRHTQQHTPPPHKPAHTPPTPTKPVTPQPTTTPNKIHTTPPTQTPAQTLGTGQLAEVP